MHGTGSCTIYLHCASITGSECFIHAPVPMKRFQGSRAPLHACRGTNTGAVWSMHCCPSNGLVAYGGEDGEVAIFKEPMLQDSRHRRAHTAVAGQLSSWAWSSADAGPLYVCRATSHVFLSNHHHAPSPCYNAEQQCQQACLLSVHGGCGQGTQGVTFPSSLWDARCVVQVCT